MLYLQNSQYLISSNLVHHVCAGIVLLSSVYIVIICSTCAFHEVSSIFIKYIIYVLLPKSDTAIPAFYIKIICPSYMYYIIIRISFTIQSLPATNTVHFLLIYMSHFRIIILIIYNTF